MFIYQVNTFLLSLILKIRNLFMFSALGFLLNLPFFSAAYADATIPYIPPSLAASAAGALGAMGAAAVEAAGGVLVAPTAAGLGAASGAAAAAVGAFAIPFCVTSYLQGANSCGGAVCDALTLSSISCNPDPAGNLTYKPPLTSSGNKYLFCPNFICLGSGDVSLYTYTTYVSAAAASCDNRIPGDYPVNITQIIDGNPNTYFSASCMHSDGKIYNNASVNFIINPKYDPHTFPPRPATPDEVGKAIGASPAAASSVGAAARAAAAYPPCTGTIGDFNGKPTCGAGANASPAEAAAAARAADAAAANALNAAQFAAAAGAVNPPATRTCGAHYLLQSDGLCVYVPASICAVGQVYTVALGCAKADPLDPTKPLDPTVPTDPNAPAVPKDLPAFCVWAGVVCDAITWIKTEPVAPVADTTVTMTAAPTSVQNFDPNQTYFNFGNSCPPDVPLNFTILGKSTSINITWSHLCTFLGDLKPFIIGAAWIGGAFIVAGVSRKGGDD